jgi:opacity protein-like surface antigen
MRHLTIFGALGALALASPAVARDHGHYIGIDAGLLMPNDTEFDYDSSDELGIEHNNGFDLDLFAGHDFGFVRAEGELSWKRATHDSYFDESDSIDGDGDTDVRSIMANVLADIGNDKWAFYAGGGAGYAVVRHELDFGQSSDLDLKDGGFAWQAIAGVRFAMNEMIDIGLKYRYFDTQKLEDDNLDFDFTSHSIMASFIYNWGGERAAPPPPPPPPPEPERG